MLDKIAANRSRCVAASENINKVETDLNEGLGLIYDQFQDTEVATRALTCCTEVRDRKRNFKFIKRLLI